MKAFKSVTIMTAAALLLMFSVAVQAADMDKRIEESARQSYVFRTYLKSDDIRIQSQDGSVTLTGIVLEEFHKSLAQDTVAGLPGVKSVDNRLVYKGEEPAKNSDAWIATKVKTTLLYHRSVSGTSTTVSVKEGVVTLHGEASSQAQKDLTTEYARDIEGVKDVNNAMVIIKPATAPQTVGEKIDDASITAQVKMTLLYHRSTSALNTSVSTQNGSVTLTGKAKSSAERDLAAKLANDVNGVTDVQNLIVIE